MSAAGPEAVMRSRYAAFALGLGGYLVETLASDHPDRAEPTAGVVQRLSRARDTQRFLGLSILHVDERGDDGEVLFFARIYERGQSCSFAELSTFVREPGGWRYASGVLVPEPLLPCGAAALTRATFLGAASSPSPARSSELRGFRHQIWPRTAAGRRGSSPGG